MPCEVTESLPEAGRDGTDSSNFHGPCRKIQHRDSSMHYQLYIQCSVIIIQLMFSKTLIIDMGWVGLWGFLWWAPSAKRKDHHGVSSGWSSVWHSSNTGLCSTQYEQIPIILGVWPFWLTPFFFSVNNIFTGLCLNCISSVEITLFLLADILLQHRTLLQMICQINGALTFFVYHFDCFFLRLIITCRLWVIYVREDNHSNVWVMITQLILAIWTLMSSVPQKAHKFILSLS